MFEPRARRAARIAAASAEVDQSAVAVEEATRDVLREAAQLFYQALYAGERVRLLTASAELAGSIFEVADRRFRAGDLAVLDVNLARSALARARAQREAGEAEQATALGGLRALLRLEEAIAVQGRLELPAAPDPEALARSVEQRPELRVLEARSPRSRRRSVGGEDVPAAELRRGPALSARRRRPHRVRRRHLHAAGVRERAGAARHRNGARRRGCAPTLDAARTRVRIELQAALAAYQRRAAAARVLETEALPGLDEAEALTARSFDVGQIGLPDVLLIRRELLDTRFQYLSSLLEAALARVEVDAAAAVLR